MVAWLKAMASGIGLALAPVRLTKSWPGRLVTGLMAIVVVGLTGVGIALALTGADVTFGGREFPMSPSDSGFATLGFVTLLFAISTVRQRKRLADLDNPLRIRTAHYIRLGSELLPVIESCKSSMELERARQGVYGWNSAVYETLNKSRRDWAARFTSAYATRDHLTKAPQTPVVQAPKVWADLQAQLDVLQEIFREGSSAKAAA